MRSRVQWKCCFFSKWNWTCHANMARKCGVTIPSSALRVVEWRTLSKARGSSKSCYPEVQLRKTFKRLFRKPILPHLQQGREPCPSVWGEIRLETWFWRHASRWAEGEIMGTTCPWPTTISAARFPAHLAVAAAAGFAKCFRSSRCQKRCQLLMLHAVSWAPSHPFLTCSCKGSNGYAIWIKS